MTIYGEFIDMQSDIQHAINCLLERDLVLLQNDAAERAITARLAIYIQDQFPTWNVDCEYNRTMDVTKRLREIGRSPCHENGASVFPDIIVHQRMTHHNLLVIEVKKTTNRTPDDFDLLKLEAFRQELGYQHGLFIRFTTGEEAAGVKNLQWVY